jgi:hypothetical protein
VQLLGSEIGIALKHFPILVSGYQRYLFNSESSLEKPGGCFMSQVMKPKVLDLEVLAGARERDADRLGIVRKDPIIASGDWPLLLQDRPGVKAGVIK